MTSPSRQGTSSTGGFLGGVPAAATGLGSATTALSNQRLNATFPTLNPPPMKTLVYAPDVNAYVVHNGIQHDLSKDIVRGWCSRKENSASSLMLTLANQGLRYNANLGSPVLGRMDRIILYLTRTTKIQVFSGYLDTVPFFQAYPGTVDIRATCTLKRLLHTWWNPALPDSQRFFDQLTASLGNDGDGQAISDSGIGSLLRNVLEQVGQWSPQSIHIQNFPQQFITFLNNYMAETNLQGANANANQQFESLLLGSDTSPGPMGAVGYSAGDPVGTAATAASNGPQFYLGQIIAAVDQRGMGPIVDNAANSQQVQQSASVLQSAPQTANQYDAALAADVAQAGQQLAQYTANWTTQNKASDAAILAVACVMVESTPAMLMEANNAVPESMSFWHDSMQVSGTGCGLFNQPNNGAWGTVAQRMNPLASAGMFLDALNAKTGWRNMDAGQAIWLVQQSSSGKIPQYTAAIQAAKVMVQAYREASQGAGNAISGALGAIPGASSVLGGGANPISGVANILAGAATTSPISTAAGALQAGRPVPDSEGAINAAYTMFLTPYLETPEGMDCSHLVQLSFGAIGMSMPRNTDGQRAFIPSIPISSIQRGDILQTSYGGHTGIYLGGGTWINTGGPTGAPGKIAPVPMGPGGLMWAGRMCANGGLDPAAPFSPVQVVNGLPVSGTTPGSSVPGTGTAPGAGTGGSTGGSSAEPIARNIFSYIFEPGAYASTLAQLFTGEKAYIDCQPLIQMVVALCSASMRNFQSSPTGDFMAYYPDHFGLDGKPAILALEDIELKDCHIDLSDDPLTTHVYIEGDYTMMGQADQVSGWLLSSGVATVQNQFLYQRLASVAPGDIENLSAQQLMNKFGVRPYKNSYEIAGNAGLEFLLACQIFMGKWSAQFTTDIGLTFMPELYPGMRILLVGHNLTVYVSQVTHEFDWQRGFTTTATVSAAGKPQAASNIYSSLPGFLNPVSTDPTGGGNTTNGGQPVTAPFAAPIPGGLLDNVDPRRSNGTF